jgi:hypothetical protein
LSQLVAEEQTFLETQTQMVEMEQTLHLDLTLLLAVAVAEELTDRLDSRAQEDRQAVEDLVETMQQAVAEVELDSLVKEVTAL